MDDGLVWRMILHETPRRVFGALVQVTTKHGRLCGVHEFGRAVRFRPRHSLAGPVLEVRLTPHEVGTLVEVVSVSGAQAEVPAVAESIGSLVHQLREHFDPTPPTMLMAS
jgi:hypothetical protein